jgi:hypothetical protein
MVLYIHVGPGDERKFWKLRHVVSSNIVFPNHALEAPRPFNRADASFRYFESQGLPMEWIMKRLKLSKKLDGRDLKDALERRMELYPHEDRGVPRDLYYPTILVGGGVNTITLDEKNMGNMLRCLRAELVTNIVSGVSDFSIAGMLSLLTEVEAFEQGKIFVELQKKDKDKILSNAYSELKDVIYKHHPMLPAVRKALAFCCGKHCRLGMQAAFREFPHDLVEMIVGFLFLSYSYK